MIKKINLILISIGLGLTINYNFGYIMLLPVILFYLQKDYKTLFYVVPTIMFTTLIFNYEYILYLLIVIITISLLYYLINKLLVNKKLKILLYTLSLIITNILFFIITKTIVNIPLIILLILISVFIWLFLYFEDYLYLNNLLKHQALYTEHIIVIIAVLGASNITISNIQLGLILAAYFVIYYSRSFHNIYSLILGVILFLIEYLGFGLNESILLLLLTSFYFFDYNYLFFLVNLIFVIFLLTTDLFKEIYLLVLMLLLVLFELMWSLIIKKNNLKTMSDKLMYDIKMSSITTEYEAFTMFLEYFITTFKNTKEYSDQMKKAIECVTSRHCNRCSIQNECYRNNKHSLVYEFKNLIENNNSSKEFKNYCPSFGELTKTTQMLSKQMSNKNSPTNEILLAVLNETKQVLDKYNSDIESKKILDYIELKTFHTSIYESTFRIKDIKYHKIFKDDINIEVIVAKNELNNHDDLITFITSLFSMPVAVTKRITEKEYIYTITLKEKFHIQYGYGSLSSKQNELCGDNYLIKSYNNGHFLAAISDGMGKGFKAFEDSKIVLEALDSLSFCSTSLKTNIEILNLLYILQGYTERYSTIDAVDINRTNYEAYIYKLGASSSYIFHDDQTYTKLENKCLPLGIEEDIVEHKIILKPNDLILLTSDGILENTFEESKLLDLINSIKSENPQKIVYEILEYMLHTKVKVKDDMSIIILKVADIN